MYLGTHLIDVWTQISRLLQALCSWYNNKSCRLWEYSTARLKRSAKTFPHSSISIASSSTSSSASSHSVLTTQETHNRHHSTFIQFLSISLPLHPLLLPSKPTVMRAGKEMKCLRTTAMYLWQLIREGVLGLLCNNEPLMMINNQDPVGYMVATKEAPAM